MVFRFELLDLLGLFGTQTIWSIDVLDVTSEFTSQTDVISRIDLMKVVSRGPQRQNCPFFAALPILCVAAMLIQKTDLCYFNIFRVVALLMKLMYPMKPGILAFGS